MNIIAKISGTTRRGQHLEIVISHDQNYIQTSIWIDKIICTENKYLASLNPTDHRLYVQNINGFWIADGVKPVKRKKFHKKIIP